MWKRFATILLLVCVLLTGCSQHADEWIPYDEEGNYSGFFDLPDPIYSAEEAEAAGCFVLDKTAEDRGRDVWEDFLADSSAGKKTRVRIIQIFEEGTFAMDLYYDGEGYCCFRAEEPSRNWNYRYLLVLESESEGTAVVLTDDASLTFREYMWSLVSSNSNDWVDAALLFFE